MSTKEGLVTEVNNNGVAKGSHLVMDGEKFSVYDPVKSNLVDVKVGSTVKFGFSTNGKYNNIDKEGITIVGEATPETTKAATVVAEKDFAADPKQVSICRQNALTNAVNFFVGVYGNDQPSVDDILSTARAFAAFTTGQEDVQAAQELDS